MPRMFDGLIIFATALIGLLVGALLLQAACWLYNKIAAAGKPQRRLQDYSDITDSDSTEVGYGVPNIGLGYAMSIICIAAVTDGVAGFLIGRFLNDVGAAGGGLWAISPFAFVDALPASILVMAAILPTSYGKGLIVSLLSLLIWLVLGIVVAAIVFVIVVAAH